MLIDDLGMSVIIVDAGRKRAAHLGYSRSGPIDENSFRLANYLVGQDMHAAAIESYQGQLSWYAEETCNFAVTGAVSPLFIDGVEHPCNQAINIVAGQYVELGAAIKGGYNYISFDRALDLTRIKGSCTTVNREGVGGLRGDGSKLKAGDQLRFDGPARSIKPLVARQNLFTPIEAQYDIRFALGQEFASFDKDDLLIAQHNYFTVTSAMDRMGVRLDGPNISYKGQAERLPSAGLPANTIQVTSGGQVIIMLADSQTIGGYPKLGAVIKADAYKFGQMSPGSQIRLIPVDALTARQAFILYEQKWRSLFDSMSKK